MGISLFISHPHHLSSGIFYGLYFTAVQRFGPIFRFRLRSWLTAGVQRMGINQHKKTAIEAANIFKKQYLPF
jgi:hypothetical protein